MDSFRTNLVAEMNSRVMSQKFSYRRMVEWILSVLLFFAIATVAVLISLGYEVDWLTRTVSETALVQIEGPLNGRQVNVILDDKVQTKTMPVRLSDLHPGNYHLQIQKDGYQDYGATISLAENHRFLLSPLVLIYKQLTPVADTTIAADDARFTVGTQTDLVVMSSNEVWFKDKFVTRTSADIQSLRWYPDRHFVVVETTSEILLLSLERSYTQQIMAKTKSPAPVSFFFLDSGRVLVYLEDGVVYQAPLYEPVSLIDRLGAGR